MSEHKVSCRTPNADGVTNIPNWKFDVLRAAILATIDAAGANGLPFKDLPEFVKARLSRDEISRMGSVGWHVTTVKLELEVRGEIARVAARSPQRLIRCQAP
ncbi:MAG: DUF6958 family protein [Boseongicola sp.]